MVELAEITGEDDQTAVNYRANVRTKRANTSLEIYT